MIQFEHVSKEYEGKKVVSDLNFEIQQGEFFILVGPSGSGKTTLLKMINRLLEQTEGNIYLEGKNSKDYNTRQLRFNIGYVLQQIALFPNLTVLENIELIPEMKNWEKRKRREKAKELMKRVGLNPEKYANRYPRDLSGGEQQRVGILRAIIFNPKILLMDEPFSALDPISRNQLQDLIKKIHKEFGMTIVFVTHDMKEAMKLGDRICIMKNGKQIQLATPENIRENPANQFVEEFFR
ncbi:glycine/betaine ABC transporter ATP-binding protein [Fusobacterium necrophorum subsp. funduliforme]|mgnify:CR=1 FL=1|uniref:ABC transporter, ATP-binding protein n=5 Tax=Fusobacterium necrophorum TaxID=859 RepID=A0AAN4AS14_9FUSO|nr:ABC transporter ATP-binding protein [Fusobacterium necrophorum]AYV92675.1 ABC transporter ATP-binding protein [Fusobacterium necrophorum subsp. funduliforme]AYV94753.1 ABC transporter ATP-binding protein [Fusobacterium necrophorum subsp. funduliforme]EFS23303.1 ABC transporter, ATP-binding protein [Fusobacterium necrophorum D12]EIJ72318.1 ABC transporter, ATP-binding protein [Fusobacterium necrophorum subsp. funduliforme ATCC 51357]EJU15308.1 ABC transporter, ATP-binding protein [Fusobacter